MPESLRKQLRNWLPWLGAVILLAWVLRPYLTDPQQRDKLVQAFASVAPWAGPVVPLLFLGILTADAFAIWRTFGQFGVRMSYRESLVIRGSTYLLALLNYSVGQGGIIYFVHRQRGVPVVRAVGIVLLIMGLNLVALLLMTGAGMLLSPPSAEMGALRVLVLGLCLALPVYVAIVVARLGFLARREVLSPLFEAGLAGHARALLVRLPHIASLMVANYVVFRMFGVEVPVEAYLRDMPIAFFVAVLPITPQGLGTAQWVQTLFFARYAPAGDPLQRDAIIIAASLFWIACGMTLQAVTGAVCLRLGGRKMVAETPAGTAAD
jgi:hypothetical protein